MENSISIIIPAYNEEKTIAQAIRGTELALQESKIKDYEIIVINDKSKDRTGEIIDGLAKTNGHLRIVHNQINRNSGYNMRLGVSMATKKYCCNPINADNYPQRESFQKLFFAIGEKDVVLARLIGYGDRPWTRRFISWLFVWVTNILFGLSVRYYSGPVIAKTTEWQTIPMTTDGFAYTAEVIITLLKRGLSYKEIPIALSPERKGINLVVLRRNIINVAKTMLSMFWRLNIKKELYALARQTVQ